ncbi:hypothetical protein HOLleu_37336 [Holothuria leucospilota]|uniref:Uncharacterized protein n=1 Tax=Holothuria leucospilota TaxID=206669 RepID=A0A9Q0YKU3_HOLLE|nr:hypothetical protein HOLleu_37336 [Holothuria leucospilota]
MRTKTLTENGLDYQVNEKRRKFKLGVNSWQRAARKLELILTDSKDISLIKAERDKLEIEMNSLESLFQSLNELIEMEVDSPEETKLGTLQADHYSLVRKVGDVIREIKSEQSHVGSTGSISSSSKSGGKASSRASARSSKKLGYATKAAALRTKLKYVDIEEAKAAELKRIKTLKELDVAEAKFNAISKLDQDIEESTQLAPDGRDEYVHEYVKKHALVKDPSEFVPVCSTTTVPNAETKDVFEPVTASNNNDYVSYTGHHTLPVSQEQQGLTGQVSNQSARQDQDQNQVLELTKLFTDHVNLSRLPVPEPTIFTGDPLKYPDWKVSFDMLIDQRRVPESERTHYLKMYTGGIVREAIEGYFLVASPTAYKEARDLLVHRFGNSYIVANAFRDRLESWPKIPNHDGNASRRFSDFLRQCVIAKKSIPSLKVLDDDRKNHKLLGKLPAWMIPKWGNIVSDFQERLGIFFLHSRNSRSL